MADGRWTAAAKRAIAEAHAQLPDNVSFTARKKAIRAAYPFGEREYWPYKAWCKAVRAYLRPYDPRTPMQKTPRELLQERVAAGDIVFPFAGENHAG